MVQALNKYLAHAGVCSRRAAVELIKSGVVTVDGVVITDPAYRVGPGARVICRNRPVVAQKFLYIVMNKPIGYVTTRSDEQGRKTVMDLFIDKRLKKSVYPVGRLDYNTSGVLLLTNDGDLAYALSHPKFAVSKMYTAVLEKPIERSDVEKIEQGVKLKDGLIQVDRMKVLARGMVVQIMLHSGRYRIIRRLFSALGYRVTKLDRTEFAGVAKRGMPSGAYRFLTDQQVKKLKAQIKV